MNDGRVWRNAGLVAIALILPGFSGCGDGSSTPQNQWPGPGGTAAGVPQAGAAGQSSGGTGGGQVAIGGAGGDVEASGSGTSAAGAGAGGGTQIPDGGTGDGGGSTDAAPGSGGAEGGAGAAALAGQGGTGGTSSQDDPVCDLPDPSEFQSNLTLGGGGTQYTESDHFIVFGAGDPDTVLNLLEAAHQCFVEDWCWRSTGLSITSDDGTYYRTNVYSRPFLGAGGYMGYDDYAGLSYLEVLASQITYPQVTVHEYGHALTLAAEGWVEQKNTGFWWEAVANWVADTFLTSTYCESARNNHGIATGSTIIELDRVYGLSYTVICNDQNYYQAWPFLTYITNNPDNYSGLGRMVIPNMFRLHQGNNETPLHVLERMASPVTVQTILGRYWARMAYLDIGHPQAQQEFLGQRDSLGYAANWDSLGAQTYGVKANRRPQYGGANITPLSVTGNGDVTVQVTNRGNGLPESGLSATLAIRSSQGSVRYVDLPDGTGQATVARDEEASLVVVNTPATLYMYDPEFVGSPENVGLDYEVEIAGAVPAS